MLRVGDVELNPSARVARRNGHLLDLTSVEFDLLRELLRNAGQVVTVPGYMENLQFGFQLTPTTELTNHRRLVAAAEAGGLDVVGVQDHPYVPDLVDAFSLIGDLLARTERLRFFPDVANLPLRPPAMLVLKGPGAIAFTRIPCGASSIAACRTRLLTAALVAE